MNDKSFQLKYDSSKYVILLFHIIPYSDVESLMSNRNGKKGFINIHSVIKPIDF